MEEWEIPLRFASYEGQEGGAGTDKDEHRTSYIERRMGKDEGSSHSRFAVGFLKTNEDNVTLLDLIFLNLNFLF